MCGKILREVRGMDYNPQLLPLAKLTEDEEAIAQTLIENHLKLTTTMATNQTIDKDRIRMVRSKMLHNTIVALWEQSDHQTTARAIAKQIGIDRHLVAKTIRDLGYDGVRAHANGATTKAPLNAKKREKEFIERIKGVPAPTLANLDEFIEKNRQLDPMHPLQSLPYPVAKKLVYEVFSDVSAKASHNVIPLSKTRLKQLKTDVYARKMFLMGMQLDFPENTTAQNWALVMGDANGAHRLRKLSPFEQEKILTLYRQGYTLNELATQFEISYKKAKKLIEDAGIANEGEDKRQQRRRKKSLNALAQITPAQHQKGGRRSRQKQLKVPIDYLGRIPQWAYEIVDRQNGIDWFEKIDELVDDESSVINLLENANRVCGRKISIAELDLVFPPVVGIKNFSDKIYRNYPNDQQIKQLTSPASKQETLVESLLRQLGVEYQRHAKVIKGTKNNEIDFYLPKQRVGIEVSPIRTHNSNQYQQLFFADPKKPGYHATKARLCEAQGIKLLTLFENSLVPSVFFEKTAPRIKRMITGQAPRTYYGRQTVIRVIDRDAATNFLNAYHDDGNAPARYRYGIFLAKTNELVGVATFALPQSPTYKQQNLLELKRLAWLPDVQVRYGISKVLATVQRDLIGQFDGILTYSNNNIGWGQGYAKAGFELIKRSQPQKTFVNPLHPEDHYSWSIATSWGAKSGVLAKAFGSQELSNQEAQKLIETKMPHRADRGHGYCVQYDCGNKVWIKRWK